MIDRLHLVRASLIFFALALSCFALLFCTGCAKSRKGQLLNVGVVVSAGADYWETRAAIDSGRGHEANPLLQGSALRQASIKSASAAGVIALARQLDQIGHPRLAHVVRWITILVNSGVAIQNHQIGREDE